MGCDRARSTRKHLRERRISHTIRERRDQIKRRKTKGSAGGRPPAFDNVRYRERNTVERGFGRLKQWRAVATRYDKYAATYLDGILLAALVIHRVRNELTCSRRRPRQSGTGLRDLLPGAVADSETTVRQPWGFTEEWWLAMSQFPSSYR